MSIYEFQAKLSNGKEISMKEYKRKVMLIVNTASHCDYTPQYDALEKLYEKYYDKGFTILGFPCNQFEAQEPGTDEEIKTFCSLNYNVKFPIFKKIEVNGPNTHPIYQFLREQMPEDSNPNLSDELYEFLQTDHPELLDGSNIRWNFTKFLIDTEGYVVKRFAPYVLPEEIENDIENLL